MSNELFLIAHKVRNEPAFDIAIKMLCPECHGQTCNECDNGYYWIIPTSGHRAYPYYSIDLDLLGEEYNHAIRPGEMPPNLPDHYTVNASPKAHKRNLLAELGLAQSTTHPTMTGTLKRRI